MTHVAEVSDDPAYPEGGHALILFREVSRPGAGATLLIEPLTEGFDYRGPRRIEGGCRATEAGLEIAVGPEVVAALPPGVALRLVLAGTGVDAEVRWPILTQRRVESKRRPLQAAQRRTVVEGGVSGLAVESPRGEPARPREEMRGTRSADPARTVPLADGARTGPDEAPWNEGGRTVPQRADPPRADTPSADIPRADVSGRALPRGGIPSSNPLVAERPSEPAPAASTRAPERPPAERAPETRRAETPALPRPGWGSGALAASTLVAFLGGGAIVGGLWFTHSQPDTKQLGLAALPSPYEMLATLPDRSPSGTHVEPGPSVGYRLRARTASTPEETDFWTRWAARALLKRRTNDVAATLSDFATDLAGNRGSAPALAAARFLWEMAALAGDCAAMENIATAAVPEGQAGAVGQASLWRDRASSCRGGKKIPN